MNLFCLFLYFSTIGIFIYIGIIIGVLLALRFILNDGGQLDD